MSCSQSRRDDLTLRPFELQQTHSDSAAMESGPPDVMANQEPAEVVEECQGKKKSKFQTFKKFFTRKKRKEPPAAGADGGLKASQSSDDVSKTPENNKLTRSEKEKGSGSKISLGSKALSHDSVFVSDSSDANEALGASQDSIHGKVKSLQLQLKQAIRLGSPPSLMCVKRTEDAGTMSEDDGLPCSPPEYTTPHTSMNKGQRNSSISLEGVDSDDDQLPHSASSRAVSPLVVPGDFSQPASPYGCLDNSAARHKLGLRYKACNKRKPISRLDMKPEGDSVMETSMNTSITDSLEEQQKTTEVVRADELKPKVEREDEEEEEQPQHSRESLLRDKEEGEDESEAEQDVVHSPDSSSPPELCLSEEDAPDAHSPPSSKTRSRASSLGSPRATPEPPTCPKEEYLLDPLGIAYGAEENRDESDLGGEKKGEESQIQENREEESSLLEEVLSSLKTPLVSSSLGMETKAAVQEIEEEVTEKEREAVEVKEEEEEEEVKVEEAEVGEPVSNQAAPVDSIRIEEKKEEEEIDALCMSTPSCQDVEEEEVMDKEEEASEEEEELVVEHFSEHGQKEEEKKEAEEVEPEEQDDSLTGNTVMQAEEEGKEEESEVEEDVMELEKEPALEEEGGQEKKEEDDEGVDEVKERVEEPEEVMERERQDAEEMTEVLPGAADEEVAMALQEEDEGVDVAAEDDTECVPQSISDDEISTELGESVFVTVHESQEASSQSHGEEREDGEEELEEDVEIGHMEHKSDQEEDDEANQPDADHTEEEVQEREVQGGVETSHFDNTQEEKDQTEATEQDSSKPSPLSFPESHHETQTQESGTITPSKTSTTTLHINLISPSSEKVTSFFQQSPTDTHPNESEVPPHACSVPVQNTASTEEDPVDIVETVEEEEKQPDLEDEATTPATAEETANQVSSRPDQSKVRFTIAPAWQRSLSHEEAIENLTPPSSPPTCISSSSITTTGLEGVDVTEQKDPEVKAEPASSPVVELVLSPSKVRNAGTTIVRGQSSATSAPSLFKAQTPAAATTDESSVVVEGNPDNPFGVRLRKTSVLRHFSQEEENPEPPMEPPAQPSSCKVDSSQPISAKPSINQPISNKPALPKKPDLHGDSSGKTKRISEGAAACGASDGSDSPSWISVAKQKQKIYKENSLEEITVKKEEQERKSSLPMYVSSAVSREHSNKTAESTSKGIPLEISKPSVSVEKENRGVLSPPASVPSQPPKSQVLPSPVSPKPQVPSFTAKHPPQPNPPQRSLSHPTPVPVLQKSPSCTSPPPLSKIATSSKTPEPQSTTATSPPFSSRAAPEKSGSKAPGLSSQTSSSQRGLSPPALPQDEPPWMALAKKKAKAWSEMPQIVQ